MICWLQPNACHFPILNTHTYMDTYIQFMTLGDLRREVCQVKIDLVAGLGEGVYQLRVVQGLSTH